MKILCDELCRQVRFVIYPYLAKSLTINLLGDPLNISVARKYLKQKIISVVLLIGESYILPYVLTDFIVHGESCVIGNHDEMIYKSNAATWILNARRQGASNWQLFKLSYYRCINYKLLIFVYRDY